MRLLKLRWALLFLLPLVACGDPDAERANRAMGQATPQQALEQPQHWAAFLIAGDDSSPAFTNAVHRFRSVLHEPSVIRLESFSPLTQRQSDDAPAMFDELMHRMTAVSPQNDLGCFVFITSHGDRKGVSLSLDHDRDQLLTPAQLGQLLDAGCGRRPTIAIVSACHSGIFLDVSAPNRIVLTASRESRSSFGCDDTQAYTYYDACLFDHWSTSRTVHALDIAVKQCVQAKEEELGKIPSDPQTSFGNAVVDLLLPQ